MKKTIIAILFLLISFSIMSAQENDIITESKDTSIKEQTVSAQDIAEIKESLNKLLNSQLISEYNAYEKHLSDFKKTPKGRYTTGFRALVLAELNRNNHFAAIDLRFHYGYYITKGLFLSLIVDHSTGLFYDDNTFEENMALGGELGYDIFTNNIGTVDLRAAVATTVFGRTHYKFTSYDAGVYWNIGLKTDLTKASFGLGVKYYDFKSNPYSDRCTIFMSIGLKLR